ncbi:hypothetical protein GCM10020331_075390 [Ectobacillus funiculus]
MVKSWNDYFPSDNWRCLGQSRGTSPPVSREKNELQVKMENETATTGIELDKFELNGTVREAEQAEVGWSPVVTKKQAKLQ